VASVPEPGAWLGESWSSTVVKIDRVPSRLSITSITRCCGVQSATAGLVISQNAPLGPEKGRIWFSCWWPAYAMTFPRVPDTCRVETASTDELMMRRALELAERAGGHGDVPIGAVVARGAEVLGQAGNERELRRDPTAHAEVLALRQAAERLGGWRLLETTIYVTLEPCPMCAGAITLARVPRLVFGAADAKGGAVGSVIDLFAEPVVNHRPAVEAGLLAADSAALLEGFFSSRR
jgi:tRNA(adenine34) deaminase